MNNIEKHLNRVKASSGYGRGLLEAILDFGEWFMNNWEN